MIIIECQLLLIILFVIYRFASRAKSVKNKPQINEVMSDAALLKRYAKQIAKLNTELEVCINRKD